MTKPRKLALDRAFFVPGQRVCCALSGGADSTALLLALQEANSDKQSLGVILSAIHVHHGLRGHEADQDEIFVRELCGRCSVPLVVHRVDTVARQHAEREGIEEAARSLRYSVFGGELAKDTADVIATAHTLEDQAETVVMKLLRGAWTEGLGGISPVLKAEAGLKKQAGVTGISSAAGGRGSIIRPMLGVRRAEIESFLKEREQGWREDSTNADTTLTRNRVRHELMPILRSFNPAVDELLANVSVIARDEEAYWDMEASRLLPQLVLPGKPVRGGGRAVSTSFGEKSLSVEVERLRSMDPALRRRVIRASARSLGARLNFEETAKILALAGLGGHAAVKGTIGSRLELRSGFRVERSARELRLTKQGIEVPAVTP